MDVPVEYFDAVSALPLRDSRPICAWCDRGKLDVIKQWSDSCGGIMGVTLKCDAPKCGKLTSVSATPLVADSDAREGGLLRVAGDGNAGFSLMPPSWLRHA